MKNEASNTDHLTNQSKHAIYVMVCIGELIPQTVEVKMSCAIFTPSLIDNHACRHAIRVNYFIAIPRTTDMLYSNPVRNW